MPTRDETEMDEFARFFEKMGVSYTDWRVDTVTGKKKTKRSWNMAHGYHAITVAQAHFLFDKNCKYVGVQADEMGGFEPREVNDASEVREDHRD